MSAGSGVMISVISGHAHAGRRRFSGANDDADADAASGAVFRRRRSQTRDERLVFIAHRIHFVLTAAAAD